MQLSVPKRGFGVRDASSSPALALAANDAVGARPAAKRGRRSGGGQRTCVGCGERVDLQLARQQLIRLVFVPRADDDGQDVVVDLAGGGIGRGAWTHARVACVERAAKRGLARAAKTKVHADGRALSASIAAAAQRRADGLLLSARRARALAVGGQAVRDALAANRVRLLLVARDAASAARSAEVAKCHAGGLALMWSDKARFGELLNRRDVAVLAVQDAGFAAALAAAISCWETFAAERGTAATAVVTTAAKATSVRGESNIDE